MKLEKEYYKIAKEEGFLGGALKLTDEGMVYTDPKTKKAKVLAKRSQMERLVDGEINEFKFGEELSAELKIALIESGEIKPFLLFIDELNRTEPQTMKELMNIVLNKNINGYDLPWWVTIVGAVNPSSQNSTYATNEMDDAQKDRFLKIVVDAKLSDWVDYA